jgi:DNA polymerase III subunit epsilon
MVTGLDFVALDVETADSSFPESICQMGFAVVRDGKIVDNFTRTTHTPHRFGWWQNQNLSINEDEVRRAPSFLEVARSVAHLMVGPVFSHTSYDRFAVGRACAACGHVFEDVVWLDSAQVVRRAWPERYGKTGYGLKNVAADFGILFSHHDAAEDARAVAEIVIRACAEQALDVAGWAERIRKPISGTISGKTDLRRDGNIDGPLHGEVVVLTGGFDLPKAEQANLAAFAGCEVANSVSKKTTLVVVGDDRFARGERSGKWRRAEDLLQNGVPIRIMSESHFRELIAD